MSSGEIVQDIHYHIDFNGDLQRLVDQKKEDDEDDEFSDDKDICLGQVLAKFDKCMVGVSEIAGKKEDNCDYLPAEISNNTTVGTLVLENDTGLTYDPHTRCLRKADRWENTEDLSCKARKSAHTRDHCN